VGAVKGVVGYACELLNLTLEEAMDMTIQELTDAIAQTEKSIEEVIDAQIDAQMSTDVHSQSSDWDVDVDEDSPFICLADVKEA